MALCEATKEAIWLKNLMRDLGEVQESTVIWCDNQSAIKLTINHQFHQRTKHIDIRFHFIREAEENKLIQVKYIDTKEQLVDILTKPLFGTVLGYLKMKMKITT